MIRPLTWSVMVLAACGPTIASDPGGDSGQASTGDEAASSTSTHATTAADDATLPSTGGSPNTSGGGTGGCVEPSDDDGVKLDLGSPEPECDIFAQDCEAGFKCAPFGLWTRACVPIVDEPLADGQPCTSEAGSDPCGAASWCGLVDAASDTGICVPQCQGSAADPQCPAETICVIDDEFVVAFCQPPCDPFDTDACGSDTCQPTAQGWGCLPSGAQQAGDGCDQQDSCADQLLCLPTDALDQCCHGHCCATVCDQGHPCGVGQCVVLEPPPGGVAGLGYCR